tara:strand:- start:397 stop:636 length:240 start_codon:yes stop_codon:yes gene_type:complete
MPDKKEKENQVVVINDKEYKVSDFNEEQLLLVNHVYDLDRKIGGSQFNLDQLQGGRKFFMKKLEKALADDEIAEAVVQD